MKDCFPSVYDIVENGQKRPQKGFEVILEDTILFPEGGGQVQFLFFITINNLLCLLRIFVIDRPEIPSVGLRQRKFSLFMTSPSYTLSPWLFFHGRVLMMATFTKFQTCKVC